MKKLSALLIITAILFISLNAIAQEKEWKGMQFAVKAGWFIWSNDPLGGTVESNWSIAGDVKYWFGEHLGFGGEVQWTSKDAPAQTTIFGDKLEPDFEIDLTQIPVHLNIYTRLQRDNGKIVYYFGAGPSMVFVQADTARPNSGYTLSADDTVFGFNAVLGLQFSQIFFEAQYLYSEASLPIASFDPSVEREFDLNGISFWCGVRF